MLGRWTPAHLARRFLVMEAGSGSRGRSAAAWRRLRATCWALLFGAALARPAWVQERPRLDLAPEALALERGGLSREVLLTARLQADNRAVVAARIESLGAPGIDVEVQLLTPAPPTRDDLVWRATLKAAASAVDRGHVLFRLTYALSTEGTEGPAPRHAAVASLPVTTDAPTRAMAKLGVRVERGAEPIHEWRPGTFHLVFENGGDRAVRVSGIAVEAPCFLRVAPEAVASAAQAGSPGGPRDGLPRTARVIWRCPADLPLAVPLDIAAGATAAHAIRVSADAEAPPGTYPLVFTIVGGAAAGGVAESSSAVVTSVAVGVLGLAEVQTALQVPSFLLLPGALFLLSVALLRGLASRAGEGTSLLSPTNPLFWLAAVTISIAFAFFYPVATAWWLEERRDYRGSFTFADVLYVWFSAILLGAASWVLWKVGGALLVWVANMQLARRTPAASDTPRDVVRKLVSVGEQLRHPRATIKSKDASKEQQVVRLPFPAAAAGKVWVSPIGQVTLKAAQLSWAAELDTALNGNDAGELKRILDKLDQGAFAWTVGPLVREPKLVDESGLADLTPPQAILYRE